MLGFSGSLPATRVAVEGSTRRSSGSAGPWWPACWRRAARRSRQPRPTRAQLRPLALVSLGVVFGFPLFTALALHALSSATAR